MANDLYQLQLSQSYINTLSWKECILTLEMLYPYILREGSRELILFYDMTEPNKKVRISIDVRLPLDNHNPERVDDERRALTAFAYVSDFLSYTNKKEFCKTFARRTTKVISSHSFKDVIADISAPYPEDEDNGMTFTKSFPNTYRFSDGSEYRLRDTFDWEHDDYEILMAKMRDSTLPQRQKRGNVGKANMTVPELLKELEANLPDTDAVRRRISGLWKEYGNSKGDTDKDVDVK